jgi:hypothetical protein
VTLPGPFAVGIRRAPRTLAEGRRPGDAELHEDLRGCTLGWWYV